jgi:hypothetical protein
MNMKKHFVEFASPGTFFAESTTQEIDAWDVDAAKEMAHSIKERYGATPYGFRFITRGREDNELDSKVIARSHMYYLGGKVETYEEVVARNDPSESILRSNMRMNGYDRIIVNTNSWKATLPLEKDDVVLEWSSRGKSVGA